MRRFTSLAALIAISISISGCYLSHLAVGQARLLYARRPIDDVLSDPTTSAQLRESLLLIGSAREFGTELGLAVGAQYTSFVPWPGDRIVTTLVATRPREVAPVGFRFPIIGTLPYKGFFDAALAKAEATALREKGLDVCMFGVPAYSTLGWLDDPVTGPMLRESPGQLVETVLHELVHATIYVPDHIDFNEGIASFIGEEASVRFYQQAGQPEEASRRRIQVRDGRALVSELLRLRDQIAELYEADTEQIATARSALEKNARARIAALDLSSRDTQAIADAVHLNDACLALVSTYSSDLPLYNARLESLDGDLGRFVELLEAAADAEDPKSAVLANPANR